MTQSTRAQMFLDNVELLKKTGEDQAKVGTTILKALWEIYSKGLYKTEDYNGHRFESFREMCDEIIVPSYENPDYFQDFATIVERVLVYVAIRNSQDDPVKNPVTNEAITPEWLIEQKKWIGKLIAISQNIEVCQTDAEIDRLFNAAITGTREGVRKEGESIKSEKTPIPKVDFVQRNNGDGSFSLVSASMTLAQCNLILKKLADVIDLHLD